MADVIAGLNPPLLWKHFYQLTQTPRPSKKEEKIRAHLRQTIEAMGLSYDEDAVGNIVARKPATKGYEHLPTVLLQGHVDMVCEKNKGIAHDFDNDPLTLQRDGEWLTAKDTTLGADNGIGVAAALAVMEDTTLEHGPMEFLFTVDEETGLTGANALTGGFLKSTVMLNLDSEEEGALYVGCSGGKDTEARITLEFEPAPAGSFAFELLIGGLRGGHSGLDIHQGRGNAIKLLARLFTQISSMCDVRIARIEGGSKRNAIPREAESTIVIPASTVTAVKELIERYLVTVREEFGQVEPNISITLQESGAAPTVLKKEIQDRIVNLLYALPHGVKKMSADIPGLVETSTNLATITFAEKACIIGTSQRSSVESEKNDIAAQVRASFLLAGAEVTHGDGYPGWKPNMNSRALIVLKETYKEMYGDYPAIKAIHAGLECGIIGEKFPGMDMISFGPTIEGAHSPDERVHVKSVETFWNLLVAVLKNFGRN